MQKNLALLLPLCLLGQVQSLRIGVHSTCPEGVPGCWAFIHEGLERIPNLQVSENCDFLSWMVSGKTDGGRLPDPELINRRIKAVGGFFSVRGVEVVVRGRVSVSQGQLRLIIGPGSPNVRLRPASRSIEWDPESGRVRKISEECAETYGHLLRAAPNLASHPIEVSGWLTNSGGKYELEVIGYGPAKATKR